MSAVLCDNERVALAWRCLERVADPEIPVLSVVDLGIIRDVTEDAAGCLVVSLSTTYSGCPATEVIRTAVERSLGIANLAPFRIHTVLSPAWSSDWISVQGREKLRAYGIAPPENTVPNPRQLLHAPRPVACPRCASLNSERVSEFGSTPCKALYRCLSCREPFDYFKCI
ncbi:MAG TPA: 1,2-phenylacetyl-CoA epoxidase subunit PaaD [Steroidobacteraceae bacterium]